MNAAASGSEPQHGARRRALQARVAELERLPHLRVVTPGASSRPARCAALAQLCAEEGPVFAGFGRYLGFRPDLFDQDDRDALRAIPDEHEPLPTPVIPDIVLDRRSRSRLFDTLWEGHHRLGQLVLVREVRPVDEREFDLLIELERVLTPLLDAGSVRATITDYRRWHARNVSCEAWARALDRLHHAGGTGLPRVLPELTSAGRLVCEKPQGQTLANVVEHGSVHHRRAVARKLSEAWLEQLAGTGYMPLGVDLEVLQWSASGELQHTACGHSVLAASSRARFLDALLAVTDEQSYRVAACLTGEMDPMEGAGTPDEVAEDCSRLAPITQSRRDLQLSVTTAQQTFLFLRTAWRLGYRARPPLADLITSLAMLDAATQELDERDDALLDALRTIRMRKLFVDVQSLIRPASWPAELQGYLSAAIDGPDRILRGLAALSAKATDSNVAAPPRTRPPLWKTLVWGGALAILVMSPGLEAALPTVGPVVRLLGVVAATVLLLRTLRGGS